MPSAGAGTYAYIDTGVIGTDEIRVALIFKPGVVTPLGTHAIIDSSVDPAFIDTLNRPSVAQTFVENAHGRAPDGGGEPPEVEGAATAIVVGDPDTG